MVFAAADANTDITTAAVPLAIPTLWSRLVSCDLNNAQQLDVYTALDEYEYERHYFTCLCVVTDC